MYKSTRIEMIYNDICIDMIKDSVHSSPEAMEKIVFLLQYTSLKKDNKRLFRYKIYINNNKVRIEYLSDLLRTVPFTKITISYRDIGLWDNKAIRKCQKEVKKYIAMSTQEVDQLVEQILLNESLPSKYFVYQKYVNKRRRLIARHVSRYNDHFFRGWFFMVVSIFAFVALLSILFMVLLLICGVDKEYLNMGSSWIILFIPVWLFWAKYRLKPTNYEIENHYTIEE